MASRDQSPSDGGVREPHTPGPWTLDFDEVFGPQDQHIATTWCSEGFSPTTEEANGRLITAAPDMFEALLLLRSNPISNEAQKALRAAIAKATGADQ